MEDDRIEIELVPNESGIRRASAALVQRPERPVVGTDPTLETDPPDSGSDSDRPGERVRTIAIAAGVGLVALMLGWAVGRSGDQNNTASSPPTTIVATQTSPPSTALAEAPTDTIAPLDEPAPTVSWPPVARQQNATDLVAAGATIERETVGIDPRLAGSSLRLVAQQGGDLAELDLADGTLTSYVLDGLPRSYGTTIVAGEDWIVIPMFNGLDAFVVFDDGGVERADLNSDGGQMLHVPGTDQFWRKPSYFTDARFELEQIDFRGEPTGPVISIPANSWPAFGDPRGGVVVQVSGRWFAVDPDGSSPIGVGEVVALDTSTAMLYDCLALDECGLRRTDRNTGYTDEVSTEFAAFSPRFLRWWSGDASSGLSPDGRWLVSMIELDVGRSEFVVVDLLTGAVVELEPSRPGPPTAVWSDDSRFLVYLAFDGMPTAYSIETGATFPVVVDGEVRGWNSLSARP